MRALMLLVEIISALVALVCLIMLCVQLVRWLNAGHPQRSEQGAWHTKAAIVLCGTAVVHGVAAIVYGSGAPAAAYGFGWAAVGVFALAGFTMARPVHATLKNPTGLHVAFFILGVALVVAHAIAGRL